MSAVVSGTSVLSEPVKDAIRAEVQKYPQPRSALLIALHLVQGELGYVPLEAQRELAALLGIRPIEVREVVSFYPMYHEHPVGRRNVQVCVNIACALAGARQVVRALEERFGIAAGERTGMGRGRACRFREAARLDHDHRFGTGSRARRRHEFPRRGNRLEVKQDCARGDVGAEEIEQIANIDIGHLTHRHDMGESDPLGDRPVDDPSDEGARLREKGELAGEGAAKPECRVEPNSRHGDAETVRADDAQAIRAGVIEHRLFLFGREPRRDCDDRPRAPGAELPHEIRYGLGRRCDHRKLRRLR